MLFVTYAGVFRLRLICGVCVFSFGFAYMFLGCFRFSGVLFSLDLVKIGFWGLTWVFTVALGFRGGKCWFMRLIFWCID